MNEENFDYVIGVDVGGTNTDTAILCKGKVSPKYLIEVMFSVRK